MAAPFRLLDFPPPARLRRSPHLTAIAARAIRRDLEALVSHLHLDPGDWTGEEAGRSPETALGRLAERVFGCNDAVARLSLYLAQNGLAHVFEDPYAAAGDAPDDYAIHSLVDGYCRAERQNIWPADLCGPAVRFPPEPIQLLYGNDGSAGEAVPNALRAAVAEGWRHDLTAVDNCARATPPGGTVQPYDTLFRALYVALSPHLPADPERVVPELRNINPWRLLGDPQGQPLETHRRGFLNTWAANGDSEHAVELFWWANAVEGNPPQPPSCPWVSRPPDAAPAGAEPAECAARRCLCHWLRTALLGGRFPQQGREVGRSYLGRLLGLRAGVTMVCSVCGEQYQPGHACPGEGPRGRPAPPREAFHLQPGAGPEPQPFYHCRNHQPWCGVRPLPAVIARPMAGPPVLPPEGRRLAPDSGTVDAWLVNGQPVGWYLAPPPTWSRVHLTFVARNSAVPPAFKVWWFPEGEGAGEEVGTVELTAPPDGAGRAAPDGWQALDIGPISQPGRRLAVTDPAYQAPQQPLLADHRGRQALVLHLLDGGWYGVAAERLGESQEVHGTFSYDECGNYWTAGARVSLNCPRCGRPALNRPVMAFTPAPLVAPDGPGPGTPGTGGRNLASYRWPCPVDRPLHYLAYYEVVEKGRRSVRIALYCNRGHRLEKEIDRKTFDGLFPPGDGDAE
jgi:hypothetical protein